jgi:hypothetical protein
MGLKHSLRGESTPRPSARPVARQALAVAVALAVALAVTETICGSSSARKRLSK